MDSIYIFLVLLVSQTYFLTSADRKFGCLFENELCTPYEICVNDGMFGRCHSMPVPVTEVYTYDVSLSVVQRFRTLLQKLSHRGLIWEDEASQQILSKELSKLRKIPYRRLQDSIPHVYSSSKSRPSTQAMDPGDQKIKPVEVELSRNLQNILQRLGLLSQASSPTGPKSPSKSDHYQSGVFSDYYRPKSQGEGHFSPLSFFQPPYQDRHSAGDGDLLVAALRHYLSGQGPTQTEGAPKVPTLPSPLLHPSYSNSIDSVGPKENSQSQTPNLDRRLLLQTAGASQPSGPKEPFSPVDEVFIQKVLKNVGRHNVDVDDMSPKDLDQLSTLIANALQVVDQKQPQARPGPRDLGEEEEQEDEEGNEGPGEQGPGEQEEEKEEGDLPFATEKTAPESTPLEESVVQERQMEGDREPAGSNDKPQVAAGLFGKLLAYLDKSESPAQRLQEDFPGQAGVGAELGEGRGVGLENVRSKTTQSEVAVEKKSTHSMDVEEVAAVEGWIQAVEPPAAKMVYQEPLKKKVNVQELQLDVKAAVDTKKTDDDYGYVITDTE